MNQGDIVLVRYPFSDLSDYKIRPAIILSNTRFNLTHDVWIVPITTKHHDQNILLDDSLAYGTLDKQSYAKPATITTTDKETILKTIGALNKQKLVEILTQIKKNLE